MTKDPIQRRAQERSWYIMMKTEPLRFALYKYAGIQARCTGTNKSQRYIGLPFMPREEWGRFVKRTFSTMKKLHTNWKENNFERKFCPTVDRIDSSKGYIVGNCRWLTLSKNSSLGRKGKQFHNKRSYSINTIGE